MSNLTNTVEFKRNIGIELTFVPDVVVPHMDDDYCHRDWELISRHYKHAIDAECLGNSYAIDSDPGCVEYPSPILSSWKSSQEWFDISTDIGKMMNLVTTHPDQESGMGHIHVGCTFKQAASVFAESLRHPFLTWIFATPMGSQYCKSSLSALLDEELCNFNYPRKQTPNRNIRKSSWGYGTDTRDPWENIAVTLLPYNRMSAFAPRPNTSTLEIRVFDSAEDWKQQEEHIAFAQRYVEYSIKRIDFNANNPYIKDEKSADQQLKKYRKDIDLCIANFKDLLSVLCLPWERYSKYIDKNLVPAFEYGERM